MKTLLVTGASTFIRGKIFEVKVDDEDYDLLNKFSWSARYGVDEINIVLNLDTNYPFDRWFGCIIPRYNRNRASFRVKLDHFIYVMKHDVYKFKQTEVTFTNGDRLDFRKDNMQFLRSKFKKRSDKEIVERRHKMLSSKSMYPNSNIYVLMIRNFDGDVSTTVSFSKEFIQSTAMFNDDQMKKVFDTIEQSNYYYETFDTRHEEVYIFEVGNSHRITVAEVDRIAKHVFECEDNDFDAANKIATILWYFDVSGNK